jgi:hypothetical protein
LEGIIMLHKPLSLATAFLAALCLITSPIARAASQQTTPTLFAGATQVTLSDGFTSAVSSLGVKVGTISPTITSDGSVLFPVTGGVIDLSNAAGNIIHSGGLTLTAGSTRVRLQSFIIDTTGATPVLTGLVVANGALVGRIPLFNLQLPSNFSLPLQVNGPILNLSGVGLSLTSQAASALNSVFSVNAFTAGFNVGTANVFAFVNSEFEAFL